MKKLFQILLLIISIVAAAQGSGCLISKSSSGTLTSGSTCTVNANSIFRIQTTTSNLVFTIPTPTAGTYPEINIFNDSITNSKPFTLVPGGVVYPSQGVVLRYSGTKWNIQSRTGINGGDMYSDVTINQNSNGLVIKNGSNTICDFENGYYNDANGAKMFRDHAAWTSTNELVTSFESATLNTYSGEPVLEWAGTGIGLKNIGSANRVTLQNTNLTADRLYEFPNSSGELATNNSTTAFTNKSGNISQWTNDAGYLSAGADLGNIVAKSDATRFVTAATQDYYKNKDYVGSLLYWDFANGTNDWASSGSGTTWALNGSYLQASSGGGATDYTNFYRYNSFQFVCAGQQPEILNFIPTVNATNADEGIAVGVKSNDGALDFFARLDLSNTGTRGRLRIYKLVSGTATLLATSSSNLSYTTSSDNLSLKINIRVDGYIDAKVLNNSTGTSVEVVTSSLQALGQNRPAKICIWHFGGTIRIPYANFINSSPKSKRAILIGDSITNGYSSSFINAAKGDVYLEAGSGGSSADIVNCMDAIINSGAANAIIMIGMNDAIQSVSSSNYMINLRKIVNGVREAGMNPVICYVTPSNNSGYNTFIQAYNTAIASEYTGIYTIIDNYTLLSVSASPTGLLDPAYNSGDDIHPNSTGYSLIVNRIQTNTTNILLSKPALQNVTSTFTASQNFSSANINFSGATCNVGTSDANTFQIKTNNTNRSNWTSTGIQSHSQDAASSGTTPFVSYTQGNNTGGSAGVTAWNSAACTGQTSGTEISEHLWRMNVTKTWSTSVPTTQRFARFRAPTMSCASVSTSTTAATFAIEGAPAAAGSATITNPLALWVESGASAMNGSLGVNQSTVATSTLQVAGSFSLPYSAKTTTYSIAANDHTIDCTSGTFTVTLPTAVGITGRMYIIKNSGAGTITVATTSSQTIDGVTTKTLSVQYGGIKVQSTGSNWIVIEAF